MTYFYLEKGSTISADDVRGNFEHVGSGHLLPRSGVNLSTTSSSLDLGSQVNEWKTAHVNNLVLPASGTVAQTWNLVSETVLSEAATSIEVTGLTGNTANVYKFRLVLKINTTTTIGIILNGDTTASYSLLKLQNSGSITVYRTTIASSMHDVTYPVGHDVFLDGYLHARTGQPRALEYTSSFISSSPLYSLDAGEIWNNTTDTLTSLKIFAAIANGLGTGTTFAIWKAGNE